MGTESKDNGKIRANRKVRDSVFSNLMQQKKYFIQAYSELYPDSKAITEEDLDYVTIENVLANGHMYNDLAVSINSSNLVVFLEAQSTWTENIIIRVLFYIVEWLKLSLSGDSTTLYGSKKVELPHIEAYVVYTGDKKDIPTKLSLTDSFMDGERCAVDAEAYIITEDESHTVLNQYIQFSKVYTQQRKIYKDSMEAIKTAIEICISRNILKEYLEQHRMEVEDMLSFLFDEERLFNDAMKNYKAEGEAKGRAEGRVNGAIETMIDDGKPYEEIVKRLVSKFALTEAEAKEKLSAYAVMA